MDSAILAYYSVLQHYCNYLFLDETIDWPQNDLAELINNIQQVLPEKDNLVYATRVDKINWNEANFILLFIRLYLTNFV